jgi:hypothetical protein
MSESQTPDKGARPGKGAAGDQWAVQTAQTTDVNPPDAEIPANSPTERNRKQVKALEDQEKGHDMRTTDGYRMDESGRLDNYPVTPPMYTEED